MTPQGVLETIATLAGAGVLALIPKLYRVAKKTDDLLPVVRGIAEDFHPRKGPTLRETLLGIQAALYVEEYARRFKWQHSDEALFECDATGACVWVNGALANLWGLGAAELTGTEWLQCVVDDQRQHVFDKWMRAVQTGVPWEDEYDIENAATGQVLRVRAHTSACVFQSKTARYFGIVQRVDKGV